MKPNAHSTLMEVPPHSTRSNKHNLPTTLKMVEEAIHTLNCRQGFSLYKLKKYICEKYLIELNPLRRNLIKNELRTQLANGTLINVTGKGLNGSIRIETKKKKSSSNTNATETHPSGVGHNSRDATLNVTKRKKIVGKSKSAFSRSALHDRTPPNITVQPLIPHAPHRNSIGGHSHLEEDQTPRSSGRRVGHKRKLLPPPEDIVFSQEY